MADPSELMMAGTVTPWDWVCAAMETVEALSWWGETGVNRTPMIAHGYPLGYLDRCDCKNGQLLVTAGPVFWTGETFPNPSGSPDRRSTPDSDGWATTITIDYARCRPVVDERGKNPSLDDLYVYADGLYADAAAIWAGLHCAAPTWRNVIGPVVVNGWGPIERELGPCAGFTFELTGKIKVCEPCQM